VTFCPSCGAVQPDAARFCRACGTPIPETGNAGAGAAPPEPGSGAGETTPGLLSETERSAILDAEVQKYVGLGYRLVSRTATTARLMKPRGFNLGCAAIGCVLLLVGLIAYLIYYASKQGSTVFLTVDERGQVQVRFTGERPPGQVVVGPVAGGVAELTESGGIRCGACGRLNSQARTTCKSCGALLAVP